MHCKTYCFTFQKRRFCMVKVLFYAAKQPLLFFVAPCLYL